MQVHTGPHAVDRVSRPITLALAALIGTLLLLALAIVFYLSAIPYSASSRHPNFSGVWVFNPAESTLEVPQPTSMIILIDQTDSRADLVRTKTVGGETDTWRLTIPIDGPDTVEHGQSLDVRYRMFWRAQVLVLNSTSMGQDYTATNNVEYSLSADGQRLTAMENFKGPRLKYENRWVFDRR